MRIEDGKGSGRDAQVDDQNRLRTHAVTEDESLHASEEGNAYNLNTGLVSLSADTAIMYYKNTGEKDFVVEAIAIGSFDGITHSNDPYLELIRNPTGGTLISDANTTGVLNQNRNFGSSNSLSGLFYGASASGKTVSGGETIALLQATAGSRSYYGINFVLPKGSSMAVNVKLNASSGSANWYAAIIGFEKDDTTD